jgi:hypothetical protein
MLGKPTPKTTAAVCLVLLAVFGRTPPVAAQQPTFYMIIFAAQAEPNEIRASHTFATFVKVSGPDRQSVQSHTISWLPATLDIVAWRTDAEPGKNLSLQDTLRWARTMGDRLFMWGPYQINPELYRRAVAREARLQGGALQYKTVDDRYRLGIAVNCIHAVSDIDVDSRVLDTGTERGETASQLVADYLRRWIVNPKVTYPRVLQRLGLDEREFVLRGLKPVAVAAP